jgi:SNF2 family DNA or RNA helicase
MTTLADYFRSAGLPAVPEFAETIKMRFAPFEHQIADLNHMATFTRAGLYNEPGTGKTMPVQAYGIWLASQGNRVVYVMPPVLVAQFVGTLGKSYPGYDKYISSGILQGTPKQRGKLINSWEGKWPDILVMSFRMFVDYHKQLKEEQGYTCVVVDEATAVKSPSSQLHNCVKIFGGNHRNDSNGVVLMTGSPIDTNVVDAYGLIAIVTPDRYGSKKMFERTHCIFAKKVITGADGEEKNYFNQIVAYQNYDVLNQALFLQGRRVKKSDVSDLPPRLITEIPVTLNRSHRELYQKAVDERMIEIGEQVIDMTTQSALYQSMQRLLLNPDQFTDQAIENEVLITLDALLETLEGKKVVIYAWFQSSVEKLKLRYEHLNPATLYGKTVGSKREAEKMKFINDPTCRIIIANPRSGGVGVDGFQDVSSHVVFAEVCPFPGVFQQSIDRLHRTGQKAESVNVYILVPTGTVAVKLRNDLVKKDYQQELAVRDKRTILSALMGDEGVRGSLDSLSYAVEAVDDSKEVDSYLEAA